MVPKMQRIVLFIITFILWFLLVWPFDPDSGRLQMQDIAVGCVCAVVVSLIMREITKEKFFRWINPVRIFWLIVYLGVLAVSIIKANFDVAYRVLHPAMPIRPGVVKVKTSLKSATAITLLANSITLTPGTLTIDATEDGYLYVHWINVKSTDVDEASKLIVRRFEWYLKRIFE
jgi:multicomponent Na+:H+ antiporter subunit E